ncbi:pentapeptide repeat-containing protein, partial [Nostocaceae cyanobacterium CENA357]
MDAKEVLDLYQQGNRNFQGVDLKGQSFEKQNLQGIDFRQANLEEANFRGANLQGAKFIGSDIRGTDFTKAILIKADFTEAKAGLIGNKIWNELLFLFLSFIPFSLLLFIFLLPVSIWAYSLSELNFEQESEQLRFTILIFFISLVGFLNFNIVNFIQGLKASLIIFSMTATAIFLVKFNQPAILFMIVVFLLAGLIFFSISFASWLTICIEKKLNQNYLKLSKLFKAIRKTVIVLAIITLMTIYSNNLNIFLVLITITGIFFLILILIKAYLMDELKRLLIIIQLAVSFMCVIILYNQIYEKVDDYFKLSILFLQINIFAIPLYIY